MMLADLYAIQQQHRDVEPVAARKRRVGIHVDPFQRRQDQLGTQLGKFRGKLLAELAIRSRQQLQAGAAIQGGQPGRWT
jgi:hypothetical protein